MCFFGLKHDPRAPCVLFPRASSNIHPSRNRGSSSIACDSRRPRQALPCKTCTFCRSEHAHRALPRSSCSLSLPKPTAFPKRTHRVSQLRAFESGAIGLARTLQAEPRLQLQILQAFTRIRFRVQRRMPQRPARGEGRSASASSTLRLPRPPPKFKAENIRR